MKNPFKKLNKVGAAVPPRTSQEINQEYVNVCAQYGIKQYQVNVHKEEMSVLYKKIKDLNHEAFALQQATPRVEPVKEAPAETVNQ